jgi:hypothetical protein
VREERNRTGVSLGVSLVLHLVFGLALWLAPASFPQTLDLLPTQEITIEIEDVPPEHLDVVEAIPEPEPPPPVLPTTPREVTPPPPGAVIVPTPGPQVAITPEPLIEPPTVVEDHPVVEEPHDTTPRDMHVMLDPRHVSAGIAFRDGPGPSQPGPPAGLHPEAPDHGPTAEEAVRQTQEYLGAAASAKAYLSHTRPHVVHRPDGTYHYAGHAFEAVIQPDGSVTFSDRPGVQFEGLSTSGSFDLTDAIMGSAGQDPYAAEREWFMDETETIRERLEDEARASAVTTSLRRLRGRLRSIWQDETETPSHRRRMIFDLWDESSENDDGTAARQAVIDFVRETLPQGGPDAYPSDELARLNASRESTLRFNPY